MTWWRCLHNIAITICIIFMIQNIFDLRKAACTISLNTGYMVIFEDAWDRQQIRTFVNQMNPKSWVSFMVRFKKETSKPYGTMIIDRRHSVTEKDCFLKEDYCLQVPMTYDCSKQHFSHTHQGRMIFFMFSWKFS